ncbi:alpha/beta fold hydrolase [Nocardia australiensis]|uniref:alpha/beta fold hydrolase n=1 Tax=Nocardia australiensis TaxID=2887191 RepID=UPI001D14174A|nr:alpha/beta hydrolase [Nocardia australiensis]
MSFPPFVEQAVATVLGTVRVRVTGSGPAILCWPSLLMTGDMWTAQAEYFSKHYTVILVDPPGHGGSEPLSKIFSFDECAQCIIDILDALQIEVTHVLGNSWGGMIGGTFAARHPDRVGSAVLMNCTASPAGRRQRIEFGALLRLAKILGGFRGPLTRSALTAFLGPTTLRTRPDVVTFVRKSVRSADVSSVAYAIESVVPARVDQRALFATITTPVLVIAGVEDATFPNAETRAMADAIPNSTFQVLDGVAHLAALENPPMINALIEDFLPELPPR